MTAVGRGPLTLLAVGDIFVRDEDAAPYFADTGETLRAGDITFGNCEQPYAAHYPGVVPHLRSAAGFDVMSFANNHILDYGNGPFLGTLDLLRDNEIAPVGAGADIDGARTPTIIERDGVRIAFLAYSSVQVPSAGAGIDKPGCARLRVHTAYREQYEEYPGTPPFIHTWVHEDDLAACCADVRRARESADLVVVSLHWGPLLRFGELSEYQRPTAHAIVDAGADLILGHHPHIMKPIEVYREKVIFYSMGHFVMRTHAPVDTSYRSAGQVTQSMVQRNVRTFRGEFGFHPDYPLYPFALNPDTLKTMIARVEITGGAISWVGFRPCLIGTDYQPRRLAAGSAQFEDVLRFLSEAAHENDMDPVRTSVVGDEVEICR